MEVKRREFIRQLCFACGSITLIPACTSQISTWRFLTEEEAKLIEAITEQFIPADQDAGATDAKVVNFFDKQLTGYYVRHQETYRKGLKNFELSIRNEMGKSFLEVGWNDQTEILEKMEKGALPVEYWPDVDQKSFFNLMLDHTRQGFYGSPRHGGNCDYVSYKMMKIDYPHIIGQNRYGAKREGVRSRKKAS
jgi:gluconate 2-dehydrogenase gamma chain